MVVLMRIIEDKVEEILVYRGRNYKYSHSKKNILIYISQPEHYYDDWEEDGGILVVEYRPDKKNKNDRYFVLHQLSVYSHNGHIEHLDISGCDRMAKGKEH